MESTLCNPGELGCQGLIQDLGYSGLGHRALNPALIPWEPEHKGSDNPLPLPLLLPQYNETRNLEVALTQKSHHSFLKLFLLGEILDSLLQVRELGAWMQRHHLLTPAKTHKKIFLSFLSQMFPHPQSHKGI